MAALSGRFGRRAVADDARRAPAPLSALYLLRQIMLHRDSGGYLKIEGGFDRLSRGLASRVPDIRYNCELVRLDRSGPIRATVRSEGRDIFTADRVVLAVLPVLQRIRSAFPEEQIVALGYYQDRFPSDAPVCRTPFQARQGGRRTSGYRAYREIRSFGNYGRPVEGQPCLDTPGACGGPGLVLFSLLHLRLTTNRIWGRSAFSTGQMTAGIRSSPEGRVHFAATYLGL
jgi:hypothetical protein